MIDKNVPARVRWEEFERDGEFGSMRTDIRAYCPNCRRELPRTSNDKCPNCGQKLDWRLH